MPAGPRSQPPAIDGFEYLSTLGAGGFADVFLYQQHRPERKVAVKVLLQDHLSPTALDQFDAEANAMAELSAHPAIVTIYQAGVASDGRPYLAMEYCPNGNLGIKYRERQRSVAEVLIIGIQIAGAVEAAHRAGILHRDIKPANILITQYGQPELTDFGISAAKEAESAEGFSIPWSPPEAMISPRRPQLQSDVWSLAATLYTLLANRTPFWVAGGDNKSEKMIERIQRAPLPPIGRVDLPASLEQVFQVAMAKDPSQRYPTALAFGRALQRVQSEMGLSVTQIAVMENAVLPGDDELDEGTHLRSVVTIAPGVTGLTGTAQNWMSATSTGSALQNQPAAGPAAGDNTALRAPALPGTASTGNSIRSHVALWVAAVVVLIVAIGAVAFVGLHGGGSSPATAPKSSAPPAVQNPVGGQVAAPKELTGTVKGRIATFSWINPAPEAGDSYQWARLSDVGDPGDLTTVTETTVAVPLGTENKVCIEVFLVRANGQGSDQPAKACTP